MKIQCDVCNRDEASVYCSADEAALCNACDHSVHYANKLASKHQRFSLLHPSPKQVPLCDICQERKAFLFCQQDRAILCRECDIPIHKANEYTQNHNRFLLTGVKLSATSALYSPSSSAASLSTNGSSDEPVPNLKSQNSKNNEEPVSISPPILNPPSIPKTTTIATTTTTTGDKSSGWTSSISEYLIEMLPGWQVEEFLDSPPAPYGFSKTTIDDEVLLPFWNADLESHPMNSSFTSENTVAICVPQFPPFLQPSQIYPSSNMAAFGTTGQNGFKESKLEATNIKSSRKWRDDGCFTVPQISPPSTASKRSRTFWAQ